MLLRQQLLRARNQVPDARILTFAGVMRLVVLFWHGCGAPCLQLALSLSVIVWIAAAFVFDASDQNTMEGGFKRIFGSANFWVRALEALSATHAPFVSLLPTSLL
jgi:hypothetical protein